MQTNYRKLIFILLFHLFTLFAFTQTLQISELQSLNRQIIADEDNEHPDWIELYNNGSETINLENYYLSDNSDELQKWQLPEGKILSGASQVIFASGKNRRSIFSYWYSIVQPGDSCQYVIPNKNTPATWMNSDFDDLGWETGISGIGYGDCDDATFIPMNTRSVFVRFHFFIENIQEINEAWLHMDFDDGFIAYLNGSEIARVNMGEEGTPAAFDKIAEAQHEAQLYQSKTPDAFSLHNKISLFKKGENVLAVQVHNGAQYSSDLSCIPFLSIGFHSPKNNFSEVSPFISLKSNFPHTNFKLSSSGETLYLSHETEGLVDSVSFSTIPDGFSFGRAGSSGSLWGFLAPPTPGEKNGTQLSISQVENEVLFSNHEMFLNSPIQLELSKSKNQGKIRYTTNGSTPTFSSPVYNNSILIEKNTVLKARVFEEDKIPGKTATHTYIFEKKPTLPVVSVSLDSADLWDVDKGIYILGEEYENEMPHRGANYWEDWEKVAGIEMANTAGERLFTSNCGIKIFGGYSRTQPQKSLSVFFRNAYGNDEIKNIQLFQSKPIYTFKSLVLRNGGNDYPYTRIRDAMMTSLVRNLNVDIAANQPIILYLNGEYWGHMNLREKLNEDYIENNHNVSSGKLDLLEWNGSVIEGSSEKYWQLIDFLKEENTTTEQAKNYIQESIDLDNYFDYQLSQIYFDNRDWPGNNIKYWRPQTEEGKWRWIMFDTDFGFGLYNMNKVSQNTLEFALATNGPDWPNPPWSTLIFRKVLENPEFKNQFINRFADVLNTTFLSSNVIHHIDSMKQMLVPEINRHSNKWSIPNASFWNVNLEELKYFAQNRPAYMRGFIQDVFTLNQQHNLQVSTLPSKSGIIKLNSLQITDSNWNGIYFEGVPVKLRAIPLAGYKFHSWVIEEQTITSPEIEINLEENTAVRALFTATNDDGNSVVINEINYKSNENSEAEDWVEIYNWGRFDLDISGWILKDSDDDHAFIIPKNTVLKSNAYLVICQELEDFTKIYPIENCIGDFDFGLGAENDQVRLFNQNGILVDQVSYRSEFPWPANTNGSGYTLELRKYFNDNSLAISWNSSLNYLGTPGAENSITTSSELFAINNNFEKLKIYPNPSSKDVSIEIENFSGFEPMEIQIFTIDGKLVYTNESHFQKFIWNGHNNQGLTTKTGIYICKVNCGEKVFISKIIRQ